MSWKPSPPPPRSAWASTSRTCARSCTGRSRPLPRSTTSRPGRAGRDGAPAICTLLYAAADKGLIAYFIDRAKLTEGAAGAMCTACWRPGADPIGVFRWPRRQSPPTTPRRDRRAGAGGSAGAVPGRSGDRHRAGWREAVMLSRRHAAAAMVAMKRQQNLRWDRLKAIDRYAAGDGCRRAALLGYFGDTPSPRPDELCCDNHGPARRSPLRWTSARRCCGAWSRRAGAVGRTRLTQILRGGRSRDLLAAGHHKLESHAQSRPSHRAARARGDRRG